MDFRGLRLDFRGLRMDYRGLRMDYRGHQVGEMPESREYRHESVYTLCRLCVYFVYTLLRANNHIYKQISRIVCIV